MKKALLLICIFLFSVSLIAQRGNRREQIKTLKIAYITEKLTLTTEEAQKFWPIYNSFEKQESDLRQAGRELRRGQDINDITEAEAQEIIEQYSKLENDKNDLRNKYISDLLEILPAKKVILLKKSEEDFNRRMIDEFKKRRQERRN